MLPEKGITMSTLYLIAAVVGGTLTVLQWGLSALGIGDSDGDVGSVVDHDAMFWGVLSLRAILAAVTVFGLAGLSAGSMGAGTPISLPIALGGAAAAMLLVAFCLRTLNRLTDDGTARIENSIGAQGVVYVTIPAHEKGMGKVHLNLQHRTVELDAVTYDTRPIETGTRVIVTSVVGPGMVEVIAAPEMGTPYASDNQSNAPAGTA